MRKRPTIAEEITSIKMPTQASAEIEEQLKRNFDALFLPLVAAALPNDHRQPTTWYHDLSAYTEHEKQQLIDAVNTRYTLRLSVGTIDVLQTPKNLSKTVFDNIMRRSM